MSIDEFWVSVWIVVMFLFFIGWIAYEAVQERKRLKRNKIMRRRAERHKNMHGGE